MNNSQRIRQSKTDQTTTEWGIDCCKSDLFPVTGTIVSIGEIFQINLVIFRYVIACRESLCTSGYIDSSIRRVDFS